MHAETHLCHLREAKSRHNDLKTTILRVYVCVCVCVIQIREKDCDGGVFLERAAAALQVGHVAGTAGRNHSCHAEPLHRDIRTATVT